MKEEEKLKIQSKLLLNKSYKTSEVGEQKKRNFDMPADSGNFRFGKVNHPDQFGMSDCMNQDNKFEETPKSHSGEDYKMYREDERKYD